MIDIASILAEKYMIIPKTFSNSIVRDQAGQLLKLYHGTKQQFDKFDCDKTVDGALHFGSVGQASMRAAGRNKRVIEVVLDIRNPKRCRDSGGQWKSKVLAARRAGFDGIVYLNRHEGIGIDTIMRAEVEKIDLDQLSDAAFRLFVPEACDSWIAFDAAQVSVIRDDIVEDVTEKMGQPTPNPPIPPHKSIRPALKL